MIKHIVFFSSLLTAPLVLGMEKVALAPQVAAGQITLAYGGQEHMLSLSDAHIFTHQKVFDRVTNEEKIVGLHHYASDKAHIRDVAKGKVIALSDALWIYTEEDINTFHDGYPIYEGKVYPKKTFFPARWSKQQVLDAIKDALLKNACTWKESENGFFKKYIGHCIVHDELALKVIVSHSPLKDTLISVYPESARRRLERRCNVGAIAQQQATALEKKSQEKKKQDPLLFDAAFSCNKERIQELLKGGSDPNGFDAQGRTPLMIVAQKGRYDLMVDLLEHGARVLDADAHYIKDKRGKSVLDYAIQSGNEYAVLAILQPSPALLEELNKEGETPLIYAVKTLSLDIVHLLLSCGASPNTPDANGFTPLMHVAKLLNLKNGQVQAALCILDLLMEQGADIDARNEKSKRQKGFTALMCAVEAGSEPMVQRLLELCADYELAAAKGLTARSLAVNKSHTKILEILDTYHAQKQQWEKEHGANELMFAAHKNKYARLKKVLAQEKGNTSALVNHQGKAGESALLYALEHNNVDAVLELLRAGADPRLKCYGTMSIYSYALSRTDLHQDIQDSIADAYEVATQPAREASAVKERQKQRTIEQFKKEFEAGELSLKTVESLKKIEHTGSSPLIYALRERKPPVVKALCAHKEFFQEDDPIAVAYSLHELESLEYLIASKWIKQENVHALFMRVMDDKNSDVMTLLENLPQFWFSVLKEVIVHGDKGRLATIIRQAQNVLSADLAGLCLCAAIKAGNKDAVELLLNYFPKTKDYQDDEGRNPLLYAAHEKQAAIFQLLIERGCDIHATDKQGKKVRDSIAARTPEGQAMLQGLLECETKNVRIPVDAQEIERAALAAQGWTPPMIAVRQEDMRALHAATAEEINRAGADSRTPLMIAIQENKIEPLNVLLARQDVDHNTMNNEGRSALFYAVEGNDPGRVHKILRSGVIILTRDFQGKTVFDIKCSNSIKQMLRAEALSALKLLTVCQQKCTFDFESIGLSDTQLFELAMHVIGCSAVDLFEEFCKSKSFINTVKNYLVEQLCMTLFTSRVYLLASNGKKPEVQKEVEEQEKMIKEGERFWRNLSSTMYGLLLKYGVLDRSDLISLAIVTSNMVLLHDLLNQDISCIHTYNVRMQASWAQDPQLRINILAAISEKTAYRWFTSYAIRIDSFIQIPVILFAWLLDNKEAFKLFLQHPKIDLNTIYNNNELPLWVYGALTYPDDQEIICLLSKRDDINPNVFLCGKPLVYFFSGDRYLPVIGLLMAKKHLGSPDFAVHLSAALYALIAYGKKLYDAKEYTYAYDLFKKISALDLDGKQRAYISYYLGCVLYEGLGRARDVSAAVDFLECVVHSPFDIKNQAGEVRRAEALYFLYKIYAGSKGHLANASQKAHDYLKQAYRQTFCKRIQGQAAVELAHIYLCVKEFAKAIECFEVAANQIENKQAREEAEGALKQLFKA